MRTYVKQFFFGDWTIFVPLTFLAFVAMVGLTRLFCSQFDEPADSFWTSGIVVVGALLLLAAFLPVWHGHGDGRRHGHVQLSLLFLAAVALLAFYAGGEVREHSLRRVATADAVPETLLPSSGDQLEVKLNEIEATPTLAAVSWIDRCPPDPERREQVLAALRPLLDSPNKSIKLVAFNATERWRR